MKASPTTDGVEQLDVERCAQERRSQGLPEHVTDDVVLARVAQIFTANGAGP